MAFNSSGTGNPGDEIRLAGPNIESKGGRFSAGVFEDAALNDSSKTLNLAAAVLSTDQLQAFWMTSARLEFALDATSGTRTWVMNILDGSGDVLYSHNFGTAFNGSASDSYQIDFSIGSVISTSFATDGMRDRLQNHLVLRPDWQIQFLDTSAISVAGDDMIIHVMGICYWL